MRVSVVIPAYDNATGLGECLRALVPGGAHEIIVVDDASTDDTGAVASRFGVQVLRLERNSGAGAARNHGAKHATGDVVLFVDSDVVAAPDTVARVTRVFEERPDVAAVTGPAARSRQAQSMDSIVDLAQLVRDLAVACSAPV